MGGMQGWGTVSVDPEEPVFRETWHGRAFAMGAMSMGLSGTNLDAFRHGLERLHPLDYLGDGYYGRWLNCAELLLVDSGVLPPGAVDAKARQIAGEAVASPEAVEENKPQYERGGGGSLREIDAEPRFATGDRIVASSARVPGHTRLPAYVRGHLGTVVARRPAAVLPDMTAHCIGESPQHVYTIEFSSEELWGTGAEAASLRIDLFESYMETA